MVVQNLARTRAYCENIYCEHDHDPWGNVDHIAWITLENQMTTWENQWSVVFFVRFLCNTPTTQRACTHSLTTHKGCCGEKNPRRLELWRFLQPTTRAHQIRALSLSWTMKRLRKNSIPIVSFIRLLIYWQYTFNRLLRFTDMRDNPSRLFLVVRTHSL